MKIVRVGYGEIFPNVDFGNTNVYFEANLEEDENPDQMLQELKKHCSQLTEFQNEITDLDTRKRSLYQDLAILEDRFKAATQAWKKAESDLEKLTLFAQTQGFELRAKFPSKS